MYVFPGTRKGSLNFNDMLLKLACHFQYHSQDQ